MFDGINGIFIIVS